MLSRNLLFGSSLSDPNFDNVSLLLHMDGSDGSTTFIDDSNNSLTVSVNGNAQIDTAQSKFGGAAAYLDGYGDYFGLASSSNWEFSEFTAVTIEFWVRFGSTNSGGVERIFGTGNGSVSWRVADTDLQLILQRNSGNLNVQFNRAVSGSPTSATGTSTLLNDVWYHVAVVKDGNNLNVYLDGVLDIGPVNCSAWRATATPPRIEFGTIPGESGDTVYGSRTVAMEGHFDDVRITSNVARYTSSFTPPTKAFPNS